MLVNPFGNFGSGGSGDPFFSNVKLLLHLNSSFIDSGPGFVQTGGGSAAISSTRSKFGGSSLFLDGSTSGSRLTSTAQCGFGAGQVTVEAWVRPTVDQTGRIVSAQDSVSPPPVFALRVDTGGGVTAILRDNGGGGLMVLTSTSSGLVAMNDTAWHHVAFTRDGSNVCTLWVDGVSAASTTSSTNPNAARPYFIGAFDNTQELFAGYIDDLRITEGVCRYTATFTPPATAFPDS